MDNLWISKVRVERADCWSYLAGVADSAIDLALTDPPYTISRKTGFSRLGDKSVERFAVNMEFGNWDTKQVDLPRLAEELFRTLRKGGTAVVWYDLWKTSILADAMTAAGFTQIRLIIWQKTNPVPLNSKRNYLTNSREVAVLGVKGGKPTFNSEYDNGIYQYAIPNNGTRYHPTQKPLGLFKELIRKHSNPGDLILDPFLGSGTTAVAATTEARRFTGCDIDGNYIAIAKKRIQNGQ